jgi:amidase
MKANHFTLSPVSGFVKKSDRILMAQLQVYEHANVLQDFLQSYEPDENVKDLASLIKWNEDNAAIAMPDRMSPSQDLSRAHIRSDHPGQSTLIAAAKSSMTPELHAQTIAHCRNVAGTEGLQKLMDENDLDLIISNSDSQLVGYAAWLGWPIGTFPVGALQSNGQRWGGFVVGREGKENSILRFFSAWESVRTSRR